MKFIDEVDIKGKTVFIRVDFNVPLDRNRNITDDTRIRAVLPTINYCLEANAKVILASHLGRPHGQREDQFSMAPVARRLAYRLHKKVNFAPDCIGPEVEKLKKKMKGGDVLLLENLRFHAQEEKNDEDFARELMKDIDIFVDDAFAVAHRAHASVEAVTHFAPVCVAGFLMRDEVLYFHKSMEEPARPLVAIIGGAKISSKLTALVNLLKHVDKMIIGGAMANTFLTAMGIDMGKSRIEADLVETAREIMNTARDRGIRFYLPVDAVVAADMAPRVETKIVPIQEVPAEWMALDIGPATSRLYAEVLYNAKTIVWNGPMGVFEMDAFSRGTLRMAHAVADSYAMTIVGGGDTDVAIHRSGEADRITYISTGGGAFLYLLEGKSLPAVAALDRV